MQCIYYLVCKACCRALLRCRSSRHFLAAHAGLPYVECLLRRSLEVDYLWCTTTACWLLGRD